MREEWTKFFRELKKAVEKDKLPNDKDKFGDYLVAHNKTDTFFVMMQTGSKLTLVTKDLCNSVDKETSNQILEVFRGIFGKKAEGSQFLDTIDGIIQILDTKKE